MFLYHCRLYSTIKEMKIQLQLLLSTYPVGNKNILNFWNYLGETNCNRDYYKAWTQTLNNMNTSLLSSFVNHSIYLNFSQNSRILHFEDEDCHVPLAMVFTLALAYGAVIILGVSGNLALIIIILKQKEMRNVTNILIVNLSFSDLLVTIMCLPFTFVYTLMDHWIFGEAMCKLNPFVQCASITVSVFSLVLIAIERHQLIINPRGWRPNNRHAYIGIAAIWIVAMASSLPFMMYHVLTDEPFRNITIDEYKDKYVCLDLFPFDSVRLSYTTSLLVIQYFGPLCFIFICYLKVREILFCAVCLISVCP